jgi:Rod binding domain-containing protein
MSSDLSISSGADLAVSNFAQPHSNNPGAISANETFHQAFESASKNTDSPEKIAGVAKQFEALMIGQMLKSAREASGGGWLTDEDDQEDTTGSLVMEMAEQGFSQALAERGGLGIAKMVSQNLERRETKTPSSDSDSPSPSPQPAGTATNTSSERSRPPRVPALPAAGPGSLRLPDR